MIKIIHLSFLILVLISATLNAQFGNDPFEPDTVYFQAVGSYSDDTIFVPETDPPWDITIDVMVWCDSAVSAVAAPFKDTCYHPVDMPTYLDSMKNQYYDGDTTYYLWADGGLIADWAIIHLNLYGGGTPTPPNFLVGGVAFIKKFEAPGRLARLVFTVSDLGCICLDTIPEFDPGGASFYFTKPTATSYKPQFLSKCFIISQSVGVPEEEKSSEARVFQLFNNYPNPFNPETTIEYFLSQNTWVNLSIYNLLGQRVKTLINEYQDSGLKTTRWDGKDEDGNQSSSGVYFYKLKAKDFTQSKKMILLR